MTSIPIKNGDCTLSKWPDGTNLQRQISLIRSHTRLTIFWGGVILYKLYNFYLQYKNWFLHKVLCLSVILRFHSSLVIWNTVFLFFRSFIGAASICSRNNPIEDDLLLKVGTRGRGRGQFMNPQDVCVAANGKYILMMTNNLLHIVN